MPKKGTFFHTDASKASGILVSVGGALKIALKEIIGEDKITQELLRLSVPPDAKLGDFAYTCFAAARFASRPPSELAIAIVEKMPNLPIIESVTSSGPYVNIKLNREEAFVQTASDIRRFGDNFGTNGTLAGQAIMVEYLSPNTNKPLHLGHMRNGVVGTTIARILQSCGAKVVTANNINDRGIHIAKSMLAYSLWGDGDTPESSGKKGDHFVGQYYVMYCQQEDRLRNKWFAQHGIDEQTDKDDRKKAEKQFQQECYLVRRCYQLLADWEDRKPEVMALWQKMNQWCYDGFALTNRRLGFFFDTIYYESQTYQLGKDIVARQLESGIAQRGENGVDIDLTDVKLGSKPVLLLRADGTSVYMTQDIGLAQTRFSETDFDGIIYVVGSEQEFHFKCLFEILGRFGFKWAPRLYHLSYGMVELPHGKMKSREGTIVDADELVDNLKDVAFRLILQHRPDEDEIDAGLTAEQIAIGALKYMLASTPAKNTILFDPEKAVSFEGETGPYLQYACVRIAAIEKKAKGFSVGEAEESISDEENNLVLKLSLYPDAVRRSAEEYDTSILTDALYGIAKAFSSFYASCPVIYDGCVEARRLVICQATRQVLSNGLSLLGISIPNRM